MTHVPRAAASAALLVLVGLCAGATALQRSQETPDPVRAAIGKALPPLQRSGEEWYEHRSCRSCHHASLNIMAVGAARERGFAVDEELASSVLERSRRSTALADAEIIQGDAGTNGQIGQAYRLLSLAAAGDPPSATTDACVHYLAGKQQPDGHWRSESHRPPLEDSEFTATALSARALQLYAPPGLAPEIAARVGRAHAWLATAAPRSTEESVMRLLGLAWTGGTPDELSAAAAALQSEQREDGGWAQLASRPSDAYATGQVLVALHHVAGLPATDAAFQRGVEFLLRTQQADGTWLVETRRKAEGLEYFETGFPHGTHQFISFAGTCWAVSALLSTLDPAPSPIWTRTAALQRPATEGDAGDDGLPPVIRAALREDLATLRALLDAGADVNVRGAGGLTALMVAAGSPARARLLIERGADVSARSDLGLTPLLLAAAREGGLDVLKQLLARGPAPDAANLGEALRLATLAGDTGKVDALLAAGADIEAGAGPQGSPLALASFQGDAAMIRHLIARGARLDVDTGGAPPLLYAVIDGQREAVFALLQAGADVALREGGPEGLTSLMWAATVDFGDTQVLEALLAHGADVQARAGSGETALSCARTHGNALAEQVLRAAGATD